MGDAPADAVALPLASLDDEHSLQDKKKSDLPAGYVGLICLSFWRHRSKFRGIEQVALFEGEIGRGGNL